MTSVICPLEELKAALVKIRANRRTIDQLDKMKTSELVMRVSVMGREMIDYKNMEGDIEANKADDPEFYAVTIQMITATSKDLGMTCHALDCRIPVPCG